MNAHEAPVTRDVRAVLVALATAATAACAVGPNYHRPPVDSAAAYKELGDWKPTQPSDSISKGQWWKVYNDPVLDELESKLNISNENIAAAAANFEQARAIVAEAKAGFWPSIGADFGITQRQTGLQPRSAAALQADVSGNWTLDIWGEIRRTVESNRDNAEALKATLANAQLSSQAALAMDYFDLRAQDQLQTLLDDTVKAETQSLQITQNRYKFGVAARADVVTAQTQLLSSQAQQVNARIQRGVLEHGIAVLLGQQPANFTLERGMMRTDVPVVPPGIPSQLLERRPDIATAERRMAAANAQIGIAEAAWFPTLTLSGQYSYAGTGLSTLIRTANRVWAVGPLLADTIFDGGLRFAQVRAAKAGYQSTVATYRQTVLAGFQQVEDDIITLKVLEEENGIEDQTVKAAREAEALTLNQYKAGTVPYSSVISAQTVRLSAEETALQVLSSRLSTSVGLIQAIGGGWDQTQATLQ